MSEMENCYLWKKESYIGCEDTLLTVKTPERETKESCQPSPDSSYSPPKPVVGQNSLLGMYQGDVKGMFILLYFPLSSRSTRFGKVSNLQCFGGNEGIYTT